MGSCTYGHWIDDRQDMADQWRNNRLFLNGTLEIGHHIGNKIGPFHMPYRKTNSQWHRELNMIDEIR